MQNNNRKIIKRILTFNFFKYKIQKYFFNLNHNKFIIVFIKLFKDFS